MQVQGPTEVRLSFILCERRLGMNTGSLCDTEVRLSFSPRTVGMNTGSLCDVDPHGTRFSQFIGTSAVYAHHAKQTNVHSMPKGGLTANFKLRFS